MATAAALRAGVPAGGSVTQLESRIDPASLDSVFSLLKQQNDALKALEVRLLTSGLLLLRK